MFRFLSLFGLSLATTACGPINVHLDDLIDSNVLFTPDEPVGGVASWLYEFETIDVTGCNHERSYTATSWDLNESENAVTVYFDGAWEKYYLVPHSDDLFSGDFGYESSVGVDMAGSWLRNSGIRPLACP